MGWAMRGGWGGKDTDVVVGRVQAQEQMLKRSHACMNTRRIARDLTTNTCTLSGTGECPCGWKVNRVKCLIGALRSSNIAQESNFERTVWSAYPSTPRTHIHIQTSSWHASVSPSLPSPPFPLGTAGNISMSRNRKRKISPYPEHDVAGVACGVVPLSLWPLSDRTTRSHLTSPTP